MKIIDSILMPDKRFEDIDTAKSRQISTASKYRCCCRAANKRASKNFESSSR
jgi:hypothetical protein